MRTADISRKTTETDISVRLCVDGTGKAGIRTGIGFFDHMLHHLTRHGLLDVEISAAGDLHVDFHHTVEDVGICVGEALGKALSDKEGIRRYGQSTVPMDEALASVAVDLSGRPYLAYCNPLDDRMAGEFALDLVPVFLKGFVDRAGITLHATVHAAQNPHHAAEAIFKALGRALRDAAELDSRVQGVPSTKGVMD